MPRKPEWKSRWQSIRDGASGCSDTQPHGTCAADSAHADSVAAVARGKRRRGKFCFPPRSDPCEGVV